MARKSAVENPVLETIEGIVEDAKTLVRQHVELVRQDIAAQVDHAKTAIISGGVGAGFMALAGISAASMTAHVIARTTRLPPWAGHGIVSGLLGAAGLWLLNKARTQAAVIQAGVSEQTRAVLQEDLSWLKGTSIKTSTRP